MTILDLFQKGDVYIDYPFEEMKFRFDKATNKVFARYYFKPEVEIPDSDAHFNEALSAGRVITEEQYHGDESGEAGAG